MAKAKAESPAKKVSDVRAAASMGGSGMDRVVAGGAGAEKKEFNISRDELLASFEMEKNRYDALVRRLNFLQSGQAEIAAAMDALDEIGKSGKGTRIVVPLGAGAMIEADVSNNEQVLFALAGGAVKHETVNGVRDELSKRLETLKKESARLGTEGQKIGKGLENLKNILMMAERGARTARAEAKGKGQANV